MQINNLKAKDENDSGSIHKLHFMGIGGSGMSGVAYLAEKIGYEVTGCDLEESTAYKQGIFKGHDPKHLKGADLLVVSPAIYYQNKNNPELLEGEKRKMVVTWEEFLGKYLTKDKKAICVAGTHGKSTTAAMAGKLLFDAEMDPSVIVGAKIPQWDGNARFGKGKYIVIEADEFNDNFLNYSPEIVILNNIEFDHPDYFGSVEDVFESFKKFISNLTGEKILIYNADSEGAAKLLTIIDTKDIRLIPYSLKKTKIDFSLKIPGTHNISNALGVIELGKTLGMPDDLIKESIEDFTGIGRRMELISGNSDTKVYDDYAHHPTAIKATLGAIRGTYPNAKIWAIDEPHGFARTKALLSLYKGCFDGADEVMIGPIFKARDSEDFGMTPEIVAKESNHPNAKGFDSFGKIKEILKKELKDGDVVLVMGAGKSYLWAKEIVTLIK